MASKQRIRFILICWVAIFSSPIIAQEVQSEENLDRISVDKSETHLKTLPTVQANRKLAIGLTPVLASETLRFESGGEIVKVGGYSVSLLAKGRWQADPLNRLLLGLGYKYLEVGGKFMSFDENSPEVGWNIPAHFLLVEAAYLHSFSPFSAGVAVNLHYLLDGDVKSRSEDNEDSEELRNITRETGTLRLAYDYSDRFSYYFDLGISSGSIKTTDTTSKYRDSVYLALGSDLFIF